MANTLYCTPMSRSHTHILKKHLILSLWLVSTNFWCRADGGFCVCRALSAKLGICEHGVHNCDSGFRRLTSVENKWYWPCMAFYRVVTFTQNWEITKSAQNNQADRSRGRLPDIFSSPLSTASEKIPWVHITLSFTQFPRQHVLSCWY